MKRIIKWLFVTLIIVFIGIQFVTIDKSIPEYDPNMDLIKIEEVPEDVAAIFKKACYDCHSYETVYPWYSNVAPISWQLEDHISHGREEMNFSLWAKYQVRKRLSKLLEIEEAVLEGWMPIEEYTRLGMHPEAVLTDEEKQFVSDWINTKL